MVLLLETKNSNVKSIAWLSAVSIALQCECAELDTNQSPGYRLSPHIARMNMYNARHQSRMENFTLYKGSGTATIKMIHILRKLKFFTKT